MLNLHDAVFIVVRLQVIQFRKMSIGVFIANIAFHITEDRASALIAGIARAQKGECYTVNINVKCNLLVAGNDSGAPGAENLTQHVFTY